MAWPANDRVAGFNISPAVWNATMDAFRTWGDPVDANGKAITNLVLDAEATGNAITLPFKLSFPAAKVQAGIPAAAFSLPSSGAPTPTAVVGSNSIYGTLSFSASEAQSIQDRFSLPADWSGAIDVEFKWRTSATSGSVVWQLQTAFVADAETGDPSWNTANTVTDAAKATTLQWNTCSITGLTLTGGAAGEELLFKLTRDPAHASDDLAAAAELISVNFTLRRTC